MSEVTIVRRKVYFQSLLRINTVNIEIVDLINSLSKFKVKKINI